jgi:hypothetical protein
MRIEMSKTYIDIANAVNNRTIGLFPTDVSAITGETWFVSSNQRQQGLRQVYAFGAIVPGAGLSINHGITNFSQFIRIWGTCSTNLPDYRPIPYASVAANANIDLRVTSTQIIISNSSAAPAIISGLIILEWISQP